MQKVFCTEDIGKESALPQTDLFTEHFTVIKNYIKNEFIKYIYK